MSDHFSQAGSDIPSLSVRPSVAAKMLGISERTLFTLSKRGEITWGRFGKRGVLYKVDDLKRFIDKCTGRQTISA